MNRLRGARLHRSRRQQHRRPHRSRALVPCGNANRCTHLRADEAGRWIENSVRHLLSEAQSRRPGTAALLSKMAQVLFVETLRRYMADLPTGAVGWLAGARDPLVGGALSLLHRDPARAWTLAELAREAGASRSVLGERFIKLLGEPPLTYLGRWRLLLAARQLQTTAKTALQIAIDVGYGSESAFNRAFKREFGIPPARYRRRSRGRAPAAGSQPRSRIR